jgi:hypothetical protein
MVGEARSSSIEEDEPRDRGQPTQERRGERPPPDVFHVEHPTDQYQVKWTVPDRLERDVDTVYRLRVAGLRDVHV